jgi:hypothetical protein
VTDQTITLATSDHGAVTFPEPAWCARGTHEVRGAGPAPHRSEINHQSDPFHVTVPTPGGDAVLLELVLWQDVFPEPHWTMGDRVHAVAFLTQDDSVPLDVAGLDAFADSMQDAARQIHQFANRLALVLPRGGDR